MQTTFKARYPENYLWERPPYLNSLTVAFGSYNDFHFPVHLALLIIACFEYKRKAVVFLVALIACVYDSLLLLSLRGAYSMDVFGALIFSSFAWHASWYLSYFVDVKMLGLTFQERFPDWDYHHC
jgi:hypothetical protein